jgi:hypothetical protein
MIRVLAALCAAALTLAAAPVQAAPDLDDGQVHFSFAPYLWVPGVDGDFRFTTPGGDAGVHAGPADVLGALKFTFMGNADVRLNRWSAFTDFIYIDLSTHNATVRTITGPGGIVSNPVNVDTKLGLTAIAWSAAGAYTLYDDLQFSADGFIGFRLLDTQPSLDWRFTRAVGLFPATGHSSAQTALWDAIIGLKGRLFFEPGARGWFINYYGDVGTGTSEFTGQAVGGIGYAFDWGDVIANYRYAYYSPGEMPPIIANMALQGLSIGVRFRF